jgi:hypothetical protein
MIVIWLEYYAFENNGIPNRKTFKNLNETAFLNNGGIIVRSLFAVKVLK